MPKIRALLVASGGGHLEQLMNIYSVFPPEQTQLATTRPDQAKVHGVQNPVELRDYNIRKPISCLIGLAGTFFLILRIRPEITVSTGAAPGLLCVFWTRLFGGETIWIDSVANCEKLSLSGRVASRICHKTLTQWRHMADGNKVIFEGSVL